MSDELVPAGQPSLLDQNDLEPFRCPACQCLAAVNDLCRCPCHDAPEYQTPDDDPFYVREASND